MAGSNKIQKDKKVQLSGVFIGNHLNLGEHVQEIFKKANSKVTVSSLFYNNREQFTRPLLNLGVNTAS